MKTKPINLRCPIDLYERAQEKAISMNQTMTDYVKSCIASDIEDNRVIPIVKIVPALGELSTNMNKIYQNYGNDENVKAAVKGVNNLWQILKW